MGFPIQTMIFFSALVPFLIGCDVQVEEEGKLPQVDVDADSGNLPEYEVTETEEGEMPSVDVDAKPGKLPEVDVEGPDVDVGTQPLTVPVPDIDVEMPNESESNSEAERQ